MAYTSYIVRSIMLRKPIELEGISKDLIEYARRNKVLYTLGLFDSRIRKTKAWMELERRRIAQKESIIEVMELAEKLGIRVLVVKTLKPFDYAPDDVDILVIDDKDLQIFVKALLNRGYFIRKKGTPEVTLRKIVGNTFVDLDIHTKMGAGPYEYINKYYLWKRRKYIKLDRLKIIVPNKIDELLITAAHAIMKEFMITIADIIHVLSLNEEILVQAIKQSKTIGLSIALKFLFSVADRTSAPLVKYQKKNINQVKYPLTVPIPVIISSYVENIYYRLRSHGLTPVKELLKTPSSKGIGILLRYIGV